MNGFIWRYGFDVAALFQFAVMVLTVAAVFHVIQIVSRLLAEQTKALGTGDVKLLLAV